MNELFDRIIETAYEKWLEDDKTNTPEVTAIKKNLYDKLSLHMDEDTLNQIEDEIACHVDDAVIAVSQDAFAEGFKVAYDLMTGNLK